MSSSIPSKDVKCSPAIERPVHGADRMAPGTPEVDIRIVVGIELEKRACSAYPLTHDRSPPMSQNLGHAAVTEGLRRVSKGIGGPMVNPFSDQAETDAEDQVLV